MKEDKDVKPQDVSTPMPKEEQAPLAFTNAISAHGVPDKENSDDSITSCTLDGLRETRLQASRAWKSFAGSNIPQLLFVEQEEKVIQIDEETWSIPENWFFIGDIHGDFFALYNIVEHIKKLCPDFRLIFLGDIVDRGRHPMECLWYLLNQASEYPDRIIWLAGNHDVAISYMEDTNSFSSSVIPSEFVDHLNNVDSWTPFRRQFGSEYIELVRGLPRAVLFPDGLLATHGGFPHTDLQKELQECETMDEKKAWLNSPECLQDFTWTRITKYKTKIPNRYSTGCSYGYGDFDAFCDATQDFFPTKRLVTGHDHPEGGYYTHEAWKATPALTLSGFAFDADCENKKAFNEWYQDYLVVARYRRDMTPEVIEIPVDRDDLGDYFTGEID